MASAYRIPDEPRPGALADYTVNPAWPLLAMMLGGGWIGLPWFIVNSAAMGSPRLKREAAVAALTPFVVLGVAYGADKLLDAFHAPERAIAYLFVLLIGIKLAAGYWLFDRQHRTFGIYTHFGGRIRHGASFAIASAFTRSFVVGGAFAISPWLGIVVM